MSVLSKPEDTPSEPKGKTSRFELALYGLCRFLAVGVSRLYYPGPVIGKSHLPKQGAYILAPVHRSYIDWLIAARVTKRRLRYIAKGEIWKYHSIGRFLELLGGFPVQRGTPDRVAMQRALKVLASGEPLVIFPEGTRRAGAVVENIHDGAAYLALRARVPLVPLGIAGAEDAMPRGARFPRPARVRVVVGEPLGLTSEDPLPEIDRPRISRSRAQMLSRELSASMQAAFAEAQAARATVGLGSHGAGRRRAEVVDVSTDD